MLKSQLPFVLEWYSQISSCLNGILKYPQEFTVDYILTPLLGKVAVLLEYIDLVSVKL